MQTPPKMRYPGNRGVKVNNFDKILGESPDFKNREYGSLSPRNYSNFFVKRNLGEEFDRMNKTV